MKNPFSESTIDYIRGLRDEKRPTMDAVIEVLDDLFEELSGQLDYRQIERGPVTWSWCDMTNSLLGYEKWYVLTGSTMDDTSGYPLLTIRQSVAPRLDSWISVSQLVVGPDRRSIETSIAMAIANHGGGFDGLRQSISGFVELMTGDPTQDPTSASPPKKDVN